MGVYKNTSLSTETPARAMSEDAMQKDFEFRISEKLTLSLLDAGIITADECTKIRALNRKNSTRSMRNYTEK